MKDLDFVLLKKVAILGNIYWTAKRNSEISLYHSIDFALFYVTCNKLFIFLIRNGMKYIRLK